MKLCYAIAAIAQGLGNGQQVTLLFGGVFGCVSGS